MIRTIQDDPSKRSQVPPERSAGILATEPDLVPMGSDLTPRGLGESAEGPDAAVQPIDWPPVDWPPVDWPPVEWPPVQWQLAMKNAIRSGAELRRRLQLPPEPDRTPTEHSQSVPAFPTFVPLEFLRRMRPGDPNDPLLRQVMIAPEEMAHATGFVSDPVGDLASMSASSVIRKYHGRALLVSTGACGVHCRYCFRREFPYGEVGTAVKSWEPAIDYLRTQSTTDEVILSGGDPLTLVDAKLFDLLEQLESVDHLKRLRIHTRMPVVIPQRVTSELVDRLQRSRLATWIVIHVNHPRELDDHVIERVGMLIDAGIPVLNQAVLLRGVNDCAETLIELSRKLVNHRIQPYYLHQLDRVRGAAHFEVPVETGLQLMEELRRNLPGYAVPMYVREEAGAPSKTPLQNETGHECI